MSSSIFLSDSPEETFGCGKRLGQKLETCSIIALIGELGCGKTLFTRGICEGAGVLEKYVNSPTFAFVNEYSGKLPVFHMDLYRLNTTDELFELGILDYLRKVETGIMIVEWAEKIIDILPEDYLKIEFQVLSLTSRRLEFERIGGRFNKILGPPENLGGRSINIFEASESG